MKNKLQHTAGSVNAWMLPLLAFCLPVSTSGVSVFALIIVLCWFVEGDFREKWQEITQNGVSIAVLLYLALYLAGIFWSDDKGAGMDMFRKQWKILLMPLFMTTIVAGDRRRVINFFLAGMVASMAITYLAWFDIIHFGGVTPAHPTRRLFHVVYNPMLAFAFYLVMHDFLWGGGDRRQRLLLLLLALAMALNMFITEGRTGQIAFFALVAVLFLQYFKKNIKWGVMLAAFVIPVLFTTGYFLSPTFHKRVEMARDEIAHFDRNPNTSIGLRLQFWKNSSEIIRKNLFIGVGTGDFRHAYEQVNRTSSPKLVVTDNPHNQYIFVLSQLGILGLVALLAIFVMQFRMALVCDDSWKRIRLAFPCFFLLIMLSESYIIVFETGFLFSVFSAVLFKKEPVRPE